MRAGVLGSPIAHSLSPLLHRAAYHALGLDWTYDAVEVTEQELPGFLDSRGPEWAGLSLTMPLKEAVLPLLTDRTPLVDATGAANTVVLSRGNRIGHNTDVGGLLAALQEVGMTQVRAPVILGSGATARSALAALAVMGCDQAVLVVRSPPTATLAAAARLGIVALVSPFVPGAEPSVLAGCDLLISTVPARAADPFAPYVHDVPALVDVVYDPWPTALAAACRGLVIPGTAMLLHQAAAQVALITGLAPPVGAMRAALKGPPGLAER